MIKLKIVNWFQKDECYKEQLDDRFWRVNESDSDYVKPYNEEKWKDGRIYEFETLREVLNFTESCDIDFTDEVKNAMCRWTWYELDFEYSIDASEENLMIFDISMHEEYRD